MECKEIKEGKEFLIRGINKLGDTVKKTYGPNGKTVILHDFQNNPYTTKDGVSVAKAIKFENPEMNAGSELVKQAAIKTLEEAGDGTTTSIVLATELINKGYDIFGGKALNKDHLEELDELAAVSIKYIEENSVEVKEGDLEKVARIASNSDEVITKLVKEAFEHSHIVKVEEGDSFEDKLELINGMKLKTTYFDSSFINNLSKKTAEYSNPRVIILDGKLRNISAISNLIKDTEPTVIFAEHFEDNVMALLKYNYNKGHVKIIPVKLPGVGGHRKNLMGDIADYCNASILPVNMENNNIAAMGRIEGIVVGREETVLFSDSKNKKVIKKIKELNEFMTHESNKHELDLAKLRIEGLEGSSSIIKVGGNSPAEIKERFDRVEDSVKAVECALSEGVVKGGGLTLYKSVEKISSTNRFAYCFMQPYKILNTVNVKNMEDVLDPVKVLKTAIKNSISVAKTVLSTDAIILNESQWKN